MIIVTKKINLYAHLTYKYSKVKTNTSKIENNELDNITDLLNKLEPKERIDSIIKLLPYIPTKTTGNCN